jgi:hypothetical protein
MNKFFGLLILLFCGIFLMSGCAITPSEPTVRKVSLAGSSEQDNYVKIQTPGGVTRYVPNPLKNVELSELAQGGTLVTESPMKTTKISQ